MIVERPDTVAGEPGGEGAIARRGSARNTLDSPTERHRRASPQSLTPVLRGNQLIMESSHEHE